MLDITIATKLIRNSLMIIAIPLVSFLCIYKENSSSKIKFDYRKSFPLFVIGFIALAIIRSIGDFVFVESFLITYWQTMIDVVLFASKNICLIFAMAAIGLSTDLKKLISIGYKPFVVGFFVIASIACVNFLSISYFLT